MLYDPEEHRQLAGDDWSESRALSAIDRIASDAIAVYQGPERVWPNVADDLEGDPDVPYRNAYFGAAGVAWALDYLARRGVAPGFDSARDLARRMHRDFMLAPELTSLEPPPADRRRGERGCGRYSLYTGDIGVALLVHGCIAGDHRFPFLDGALPAAAAPR